MEAVFSTSQDCRFGVEGLRRLGLTCCDPLRYSKIVIGRSICHRGPVAQRLEQGTHNPLVGGSNPSGPTMDRSSSILVSRLWRYDPPISMAGAVTGAASTARQTSRVISE